MSFIDRLGNTWEALYGEGELRLIASQLAQHFTEAGERAKAAGYALLAAELEQSRYAWAEGEHWCALGLDLVNKLPPNRETQQLRLDLLERSGNGFYKPGEYTQADQRYRAALTLAQQLQADAIRIADLCVTMADVCDNAGYSIEEAELFVKQGQRILAEWAVPFCETHISLDIQYGFLLARAGRNQEAITCLRAALADAGRLPETSILIERQAETYNILSFILGGWDYPASVAASLHAIELTHRARLENSEGTYWLNLAAVHLEHNSLEESSACNARGYKIAQQIGDMDLMAFAKHNGGGCVAGQGNATRGPHRDSRGDCARGKYRGIMEYAQYVRGLGDGKLNARRCR